MKESKTCENTWMGRRRVIHGLGGTWFGRQLQEMNQEMWVVYRKKR